MKRLHELGQKTVVIDGNTYTFFVEEIQHGEKPRHNRCYYNTRSYTFSRMWVMNSMYPDDPISTGRAILQWRHHWDNGVGPGPGEAWRCINWTSEPEYNEYGEISP